MATVKLGVHGMRDASDAERLERALQADPHVFYAVANHGEGSAEVDFDDDELEVDRLLEIVRVTGFAGELAG